jgi:DUF971 family protein
MSAHWPTDLAFDRGARTLGVTFDDGAHFDIPFELLRVESPSAEVRGHRTSDKKLVAGKRGVGLTNAEPVGRYAVRLIFDDGHDSGLYTWDLLYDLGANGAKKLDAYLAALKQAGLSRET